MLRYTFLILIVFSFSQLYAQEDIGENDTSLYTPAFDRDTNARVHFGAIVGLHYQGINYVTNSDPFYTDSIYNWSSNNHIGFSFGIIVDTRLNPHFNFSSGIHVMISKLQLNYTYQNQQYEPTTNYSTLQIPLWLSYGPKIKTNRFFYSGGAIFTTDISRRDERLNRIFLINQFNIMVGLGMGYRMRLPSLSNINYELQLHYGLLNMVANANNFYNQAVDQINLWEVSLYISMD
jgi:hypothetical protein